MMTVKEKILQEIQKVPESVLNEVLDFIQFLESKLAQEQASETMLASEPSLARDWLKPEEDEAWQDL